MWMHELKDYPELLAPVIANMREWDRREIFATLDGDDADLAEAVGGAGPVTWVAGKGDQPIAVFGCRPMWPGVWSMWFFATDEIDNIGLAVTKVIKNGIVPMLFAEGAHRLECRSMKGHTEAQRWLTVLGAKREGRLKAFGRGREDFYTYVWTA